MKRKNVELIALSAIFIAVVAVMTLVVRVPTGQGGYLSFVDVGIFFAAAAFGPIVGGLAGGLGAGLADAIAGYPAWIVFTLVIHGTQGFIVGLICRKRNLLRMLLGWIAGTTIVVVGYLFANAFLNGGGLGLALASILPNLAQTGVGALGFPLYLLVKKAWPRVTQMGQLKKWTEE